VEENFMTNRKFFKTTIVLEVFSAESIEEWELRHVVTGIRTGDLPGGVSIWTDEEIDGKQAADGLITQGLNPERFRIDKDGNDLEGDL
jgi:hypothetical protein